MEIDLQLNLNQNDIACLKIVTLSITMIHDSYLNCLH